MPNMLRNQTKKLGSLWQQLCSRRRETEDNQTQKSAFFGRKACARRCHLSRSAKKTLQERPHSTDFRRVPACSKRVRRVVQAHHHGDTPAPADSPDAVGDSVGLGRRVVATALLGQSTQSHTARRHLGRRRRRRRRCPATHRFSRCAWEEGLGSGRARAGRDQPRD